jgi:NosR/NirI family nitrous oxide reductase transcriptional regulator
MSTQRKPRSSRQFLSVLGLMAIALLIGSGKWLLSSFNFENESEHVPDVAAQALDVDLHLLREIMPRADSFSEKQGQPPVYRAYGASVNGAEQTLVGYVFLTADLPPEEVGYSGTIKVLVGMDMEAKLTGIKVLYYAETLRRLWGDFLANPGYQEQFAGKPITDAFRVDQDIDGIVRATVTFRAMSRGIRNAARRVASAYL